MPFETYLFAFFLGILVAIIKADNPLLADVPFAKESVISLFSFVILGITFKITFHFLWQKSEPL